MTRLQDDILEFYNTLQEFSKETLEGPIKTPIKVTFEKEHNSISFEQKGRKIFLPTLNYYCGSLKKIKNSWLLPDDYDQLMGNLQKVIGSGVLIQDRVCVSPEIYGFDIYKTEVSTKTFGEGPQLLESFRFVSGTSWIFKLIAKLKYNL